MLCYSLADAAATDRLPDAGNTPGGNVMNTTPSTSPYSSNGGGNSLQLDANGNFQFYFLDAYENSEVRPGESQCRNLSRRHAKRQPLLYTSDLILARI